MSGVSTEPNRPSEWLECVCCGGEDTPQKLLLCFHPCCEQCLQGISTDSDTLTCPNCSTITVGLFRWEMLQDNFLKDIQQHAATHIEPKVCIMCEPTGKSTIGTHICLECDGGHFCQECIKMHGYIPAIKSHKPILLSDFDFVKVKEAAKSLQSVPTCPEHHTDTKPLLLNFYCEPCKKAVCKTCWTEKHQTIGHQVIMLSQLSQKKCSILDNKTLALKEQIHLLEGVLSASTKTLQKNEESKEGLRNKVKGREAALKHAIDNTCQSYMDQIDAFYNDQNATLLKQSQEVQQLVQKMETIIRFREAFQGMCSEGTTVKYHDVVDTGLQRIQSEVEAAPKELPEETIAVETPTRKVTPVTMRHYLGMLCKSGTFAQGLQNGHVNVTPVWSVTVDALEDIKGIDVNAAGDILLVGDSKALDKQIHVYGDEGEQKYYIEMPIKAPHGICVMAGDIYVSDRSGSILMMTPKGEVICEHQIEGLEDGSVGVAVASDGTIYATTGGDNRLVKFIGGEGSDSEELVLAKQHLAFPFYLCLTPSNFIAVSNNFKPHKVSVFDECGSPQFHYGSSGQGNGQLLSPLGVCCDSVGRIYIADSGNHRICVISPSGAFVTNVVTAEHGIQNPRCVRLNVLGTRLVVAHSKNKLTVFKTQL